MKISLFQGILLGVFVLAALIGLFVFATYTSQNSGSGAVGAVVIWGTLPRDAMTQTLTAAAQVDQALKSVTYVEKDASTLANDLAAAIATGASPDLILASQEELLSLTSFLSAIPFNTLSAKTFQNSFTDGANVFSASGGYWGVPFLIDPLVLFSNRNILSSNGIAKPPQTWEALTGLVPNVAELSASRQVTRALIALGTYANVHNARGILSTLFLQTNVPITGYTSTGMFRADLGANVSGGVPPGQAVVRFYTQFADPTKLSYTWNASMPDSQRVFQSGDSALYLGYVSEARYLRQANPNLSFSVTQVPQPATGRTKSAYGQIYAFMVSRGSANPSGAFEAAAILSGSDMQALASAMTGLAPASLTELSRSPQDPILATAYSEALYTRGWLSPAPGLTDPVFSSMINNVTSGRTTIDTALSLAERALGALLPQ